MCFCLMLAEITLPLIIGGGAEQPSISMSAWMNTDGTVKEIQVQSVKSVGQTK